MGPNLEDVFSNPEWKTPYLNITNNDKIFEEFVPLGGDRTYGDDEAARFACEALKTAFPDREIIPLPSKAILTGGGSFHCISQQEPA